MNPTPMTSTQLLAQADILLLIRDVMIEPLLPELQLLSIENEAFLQKLFSEAGLSNAIEHAQILLPLWKEVYDNQGTELSLAYCNLFDGAAPCPINETAYIRRDKGAIIADIAGFYNAFGFEGRQIGEKIDHLVVELEFVAILLIMMDQAQKQSNSDGFEVTFEALDHFLGDHLCDWLLLFCERLIATSLLPIHHACANLLIDCIRAIIVSNQLKSVLNTSTDGAHEEDTVGPYECGMAVQTVDLTVNGCENR